MEIVKNIIEASAAAGPWIVSLLVIGGMGFIIYTLVTKSKEYDEKYQTITTNHLHEMPEMAQTLRNLDDGIGRLTDGLDRQERTLVALDSYLRARLNGGSK